jgi:hypothetical protein
MILLDALLYYLQGLPEKAEIKTRRYEDKNHGTRDISDISLCFATGFRASIIMICVSVYVTTLYE